MGTKFQGTEEEIKILNSYITLMRSVETITARLNLSLSKNKLTLSQFGVLEALYHLGPMCQKQISSKVLKSTANITTVLDNLEERGLVNRVRQKEDKRFITVYLTEKGMEVIQQVLPSDIQEIVQILKVLDEDEIERIVELCEILSKDFLNLKVEEKGIGQILSVYNRYRGRCIYCG
ncbi:MAG: MarR family transcriptional regulator, partial [Leptospiraceae bacterium]|nr:MarR family transcriptional regulator [Leptospiraceae bacterium]